MLNIYKKSLIAGLLAILICPHFSWAEARTVNLYPSYGVVTENTMVQILRDADSYKKATFFLPAEVDPKSIQIVLAVEKSLKIKNQHHKNINTVVDTPEADVLHKRMKKLRDERISVRASIEGHDAQIQFWQMQTKAKTKTVADASNLSAAIFKNTKKAWQDKLMLQLELERIDKSIKELQAEIDQTAGNTKLK
jgi:hypothetical protein